MSSIRPGLPSRPRVPLSAGLINIPHNKPAISSGNLSEDPDTTFGTSSLAIKHYRKEESAQEKASLRSRRLHASESAITDQSDKQAVPQGSGYTLWSRLTSAASELSITVNQSWTSKLAVFNGEDTPIGQESRLTKAMKAYHLAHARSISDLPEWLFSESERGTAKTSTPDMKAADFQQPAVNTLPPVTNSGIDKELRATGDRLRALRMANKDANILHGDGRQPSPQDTKKSTSALGTRQGTATRKAGLPARPSARKL